MEFSSSFVLRISKPAKVNQWVQSHFSRREAYKSEFLLREIKRPTSSANDFDIGWLAISSNSAIGRDVFKNIFNAFVKRGNWNAR